ncbi:MAG: hypothetical protein R3C53_21535 [Pirellulaceae bacterium]
MSSPNHRSWLLAFILTLPALVPLFSHFYFTQLWGRHGTGFIQYDQAYYMANARECIDHGGLALLYKNPFDYRPETPAIYCQPQTLLLAALLKLTSIPPWVLFVSFGWIFACLTVRVAYSLLNEFQPLADWPSRLVFVMFIWGGGLFTLVGSLASVMAQSSEVSFYQFITVHDPFQGWWFLNLGRNLIFPMESYYHFLFLLGALYVVRGQVNRALGIGLLLAWSHPFTGLEYLFIVAGWLWGERIFFENHKITWLSCVLAACMLALHVGYYKVFLPSFPAHREVHELWQLEWEYKLGAMLLGYGIVASLALWHLRTSRHFAAFVQFEKNRFLLAWFAGAFLLANHEFFMKSVQPLHFTRGYVWIPLFLIGSPKLYEILQRTLTSPDLKRASQITGVLGICGLVLLDNAVWLPLSSSDEGHNALHTRLNHAEVMEVLNSQSDTTAIVVSNSSVLGYLATVSTTNPVYFGHAMLTPQGQQKLGKLKQLFETGELIPELADHNQLLIIDQIEDRNAVRLTVDSATIRRNYEDMGFDVQTLANTADYSVWYCKR